MMNILEFVMVFNQCFKKNVANKPNKNRTTLHSKRHHPIKLTSNSQKKYSKSFLKVLTTKVKWSLRPFRNKIANSNLYQRWYIFGWFAIICGFLPSFILYIFLLFGYFYPKFLLSTILSIFIKTKTWFKYAIWLSIFSFIIGFAIEVLSVWKKRSKELIIAFSVIGAIATFTSNYIARWIIVYLTKIEPVASSKALIILSIINAVILWLGLAGLFLLLIYCFTLALQVFMVAPFNIRYFASIRNQGWYRFLLRKSEDTHIEKRIQKISTNFLLFGGGTAIGAALWSFIILLILSPLTSIVYEFPKAWLDLVLKKITIDTGLLYIISQILITPTYIPSNINSSFWTHIAETIIVYSDYRPETLISECTNLEQGEWGLLIGLKKISVAKHRKSEGYIFTTKSCLFENSIINKG